MKWRADIKELVGTGRVKRHIVKISDTSYCVVMLMRQCFDLNCYNKSQWFRLSTGT